MSIKQLLTILGLSLSIIAGTCFSVSAQAKKHIDCSAAEMKKAELQYQEMIKPLLATVAEQYSGSKKDLEVKLEKRARLFRQWLDMRCTCQPPDQGRFEKMLCLAKSEAVSVRGIKTCLIPAEASFQNPNR